MISLSEEKDEKVYQKEETPVTILEDMANTFRKRRPVYGESYEVVGKVLEKLFPNGVELQIADEFNRYHMLTMIVAKLTRFANNDMKHKDSIHDIGVYAAMLESLL